MQIPVGLGLAWTGRLTSVSFGERTLRVPWRESGLGVVLPGSNRIFDLGMLGGSLGSRAGLFPLLPGAVVIAPW